jgi:hypothetical protein
MNSDKTEISIELSRMIERQTKFFEKSDPTSSELQEFEWLVSVSANSLLSRNNRIRRHSES